MSSLTADSGTALKQVRSQVPNGVLEWIQHFDAAVEPEVAADQRFDFRIYLIPQTGVKSEADAAMTFDHSKDLTPEQNAVMDQARTIIREKQIPVADLGTLRPAQVVERVAGALKNPFNLHTQARKYFRVRPGSESTTPSATKADFCRYNEAFEQYVYTESWVNYLIRKLSNQETSHNCIQPQEADRPPDPGECLRAGQRPTWVVVGGAIR